MEVLPQVREALVNIQTEYMQMPQLKLTRLRCGGCGACPVTA